MNETKGQAMKNMTNLKWSAVAGMVLALWTAEGWGAAPGPEKLAGSDALAVFTVPDYAKASASARQWPMTKFWRDPAMRPFATKFGEKFKSDLVEPLEKEFGIQFGDYTGLAQGQITLAIVPNGWGTEEGREPAFLFLLDSGSRGEELKMRLDGLKKRWTEAGKGMRSETIRGVEFSVLTFSSDDLDKSLERLFPDPEAGFDSLEPRRPERDKSPEKVEWYVGQSESLLVVGSAKEEVEKLLARKAGGTLTPLSENAQFASEHTRLFRNSLGYGWINLKSIVDTATRMLEQKGAGNQNELVPTPAASKVVGALGLNGLLGAAGALTETGDGAVLTVNLQAPASTRKGVLNLLAFEGKDTAPPSFVPADAVKFSRTRLDLQKVWSTLESAAVEIQPQIAGVIKLFLDNAGKDQDPNFDLRKNLIGNLGDDLVSFQKEPRGRTLADLNSQPTLTLISSPQADQLAAAVKAIASLMPGQGGKIREREFLGRTLYSIDLPPSRSADGKVTSPKLTYVASGGYVAMSTDTAILEEFLRGAASKPLKSAPGLASAAEKVGGMNAGLFGYEDDRQTMRFMFEILKKESGTLANLFDGSPLAGRLGVDGGETKFKDWLDFSLLPSYDSVMKYFHFSVYGAGANSDGIFFKVFTPNPPGLN